MGALLLFFQDRKKSNKGVQIVFWPIILLILSRGGGRLFDVCIPEIFAGHWVTGTFKPEKSVKDTF